MTITAYDICDWVASQSGHAIGPDEGIVFGPPRQDVRGVSVCWTPDPPAIEAAAKAGHQLLVHHETLTYPYPGLGYAGLDNTLERHYLAWQTNAQRLLAMGQAGLTSCRIHMSADEITIYKRFAQMLGLTRVADGKGYGLVYEIDSTPYGQLIQRVKTAMGMPGLRATCCRGMDRIVRRVGLPWGGLGLFPNLAYPAMLIEYGLDVMISGDSDNIGMRFCTEVGIDVIETSHELSEIPGMKVLAQEMAKAFPQLDVRFIDQPCVWQIA